MKRYIGIAAMVLTMGSLLLVYSNTQKRAVDYEAPFELYRGADPNVIIKNKIIEDGRNQAKQQRSMDSSLIMLIISTAGIFATILFNPKLSKIAANQEKIAKENNDQHETIFRELKNINTVTTIEMDLREILSHCLEIAPKGIQRFVNFEGENNIKFAQQVLNSKFNETYIESIRAKICAYSMDAIKEAEPLPEGFRKEFVKIQKVNTDMIFKELESIVYDNRFNSKHARFKILITQVLNRHLHSIIDIYKKYDK